MSKLKKIDEAWLGLDIVDEQLFNPTAILAGSDEDFHLKLTWLMSRPEYFSFTCNQLLNTQLLPSQALIINEIWHRKFPLLIASRGFGKSFQLALYSILRALLLPRRKIVVVGAAFRQSKVVFEYMETIWRNSPMLRDVCSSTSGPTRDVDRCTMRINESIITCLPLGDGQKIRGQRANDIIADEFACLERGSLVETTDGLVRIEDFESARGSRLFTGDLEHPLESPNKFIKTPITDIYEIKLDNGYVIRCSEPHQVMTRHGWKKPLELNKGDWVEKSPNGYFGHKIADGLNLDICWLLGLLVSEGSVVNESLMSIKTTNYDLALEIQKRFGWKIFPKEAHTDPRGWDCKESYDIYISDKELRGKLFRLGLNHTTAHGKIIPSSILSAPREYVTTFLRGLFDGDGSCFLWKDRERDNMIGLAYYSVSERLCRDVQILMNKLGYDGYINKRKSKISKNWQWFVRWNNQQAKDAATELAVPRFAHAIESCYIPPEPTHITFDKSRNKWKISYSYCGQTIQKRFDRREEAVAAAQELKNSTQYRRVVDVIKLDHQDHLYDYYLPKTNSFYAEGHRQHNSIPRDIFENVVAGFAAVSANPIQNVKRLAAQKKAIELGVEIVAEETSKDQKDNQIILSGTAYYDFNHFATYWKKWKAIIKSGGNKVKLRELFNGEDPPENFDWTQYSIIRMPYELLPPGFMDADQVARSKATVHIGIYQMEYGACFTRDSQGFFKRSLIESCVISKENTIKDSAGNEINFEASLIGDQRKKYIFGVDPASEVDNFSIVVLEVNSDHRRVVYCWTTTRSEHKEKIKRGLSFETDFYSYCARKIRDLMVLFPCVHIAIDAQGGGIAVTESLHDQDKIKDTELPLWPTVDENKAKDTDDQRGLHIIEMCQFAKHEWLAEANHGMRKDFEDKVLVFPFFDAISIGLSSEQDNLKNRTHDTLEDCVLEIEQLKDELAMI